MGTALVYSTALLFVAVIAASTNAPISSISVTTTTSTTTTTPPSKLTSTAEATIAPKSKRGVVEIGTNIWAGNGGFQSKPAGSSTNSATVNQNSGSPSSQRLSTSSSAYSPVQNNGRASVYNNQNSGYRQAAPYSSLSYTNVDDSYGNGGQTYGSSEPSFGSAAQSYLSSPQNYGSTDEGQNAAFAALYLPQSQSTQGSPNFGSYHSTQPVTSSAQTQSSQGSGQIQNGAISTPYYTSFASAPSSMKIFTDKLAASGQYGASLVQPPQGQQSVHKTQSTYAPHHQSGSYSIPSMSSYPYQQGASLSQGSPYASQGGPVFAATSQIHRNTPKNGLSGLKSPAEFAQMYAPHYQSASTFVPNIQSGGFAPATVDFNGKKIPLPVLQLQSAEDFPGFAQSIHAQPIVLEANSPFQIQNDFSFLNDFAKSLTPQTGNIVPFLNPQQPSQPQVLPVRSANGTPQFPQYKGARINTSPNYNLGKPVQSYEPLHTQPQLHFTEKSAPLPPASAPFSTSSIIHHPPLTSRPVSEIRDDVEVLNKKKRPTPPPHDFDEDEVDEGYRAIEREYGQQHDDAEDEGTHRGKNFKESNTESDFKPSKSFPFKPYDEQFHKYSKPSSDEDSEEERPVSRYRHPSSAEEDDDHDGYSSTHHADYRSPQARPSRYEDDGEESQRNERQEEAEEDEEPRRRPSSYSSYGKDFEQEFEDSYRRELPKSKYVHVKEVPEIDEPAASSPKSYSSSDSQQKSSRQKGRKGHHHSYHHDEDPEESKSYSTHSSQKYGKAPKNRDSDGYSSNIRSYNKGQSPKVVHEESFGYKAPESTGYSKYKKSPSGDSYSSVKKSPKMDSYLQASRSSYKAPKSDNSYENGDSYSYSSGSNWKADKKAPESSDYHGHGSSVVKSLALPDQKSTFHAPAIGRGSFFFSRNDKIVRDLTGI